MFLSFLAIFMFFYLPCATCFGQSNNLGVSIMPFLFVLISFGRALFVEILDPVYTTERRTELLFGHDTTFLNRVYTEAKRNGTKFDLVYT